MADMAFKPVVLCGPSGSGKSTLVKKLMDEFKGCFAFTISHTTRKPRPGEEHGREYYFITVDEMKKKIDNDEFIEHAVFSGNMYGTSIQAVEDIKKQGRICILDVDVQGVKSIKKTNLNPRYIFISPPNLKELEARLRGRGTETEEALQKRLTTARVEMDYGDERNANFDHTVINDDLEVAYEKLKGILIKDIEEIMKHKARVRRKGKKTNRTLMRASNNECVSTDQ